MSGEFDYLYNDGSYGCSWKAFLIFVCVVALMVLLTISWWLPTCYTAAIDIYVVDHPGLESQNQKYLVWVKNLSEDKNETLQNTDNFFAGKMDSSDVQGELKAGHYYHATVIGWRNEMMSQYRNITQYCEYDPPEKEVAKTAEVKIADEPVRVSNKQCFCTSCGKKALPSDKFCSGCDHKLR